MSPNVFALIVSSTLVFGALTIGALVWWFLAAQRSARVQRRLQTDGSVADTDFAGQGEAELLQAVARGGKQIEGWLDAKGESAQLLVRAGWRSSSQRMSYYLAQALLPFALAGVGALAWFFSTGKLHQPAMLILLSLMGLILGALLPRMILRRKAEGRQRRIKNEVPLFIHLLVLLFEAGLSTRQALASLVREGRGVLPELGMEFEGVLRQLDAGADLSEVLKRLEQAMDVEDLGSTLAILRQVDRYGGEIRGPLIEALEVMEQRREIDMREMVNLLSDRMTVVMVLFFFPALLIFVAGPAFVSIIKMLGEVNG